MSNTEHKPVADGLDNSKRNPMSPYFKYFVNGDPSTLPSLEVELPGNIKEFLEGIDYDYPTFHDGTGTLDKKADEELLMMVVLSKACIRLAEELKNIKNSIFFTREDNDLVEAFIKFYNPYSPAFSAKDLAQTSGRKKSLVSRSSGIRITGLFYDLVESQDPEEDGSAFIYFELRREGNRPLSVGISALSPDGLTVQISPLVENL